MAFITHVGVGTNTQDSFQAGCDAAHEALTEGGAGGGARTPSFALVLASSVFDQKEMIRGVHETLGGVPFVGCTTAGAIVDEAVEEQAVVVITLESDTITFAPIKSEGISADMYEAGVRFGTEVKKSANGAQKLAFIFSDALSGNGTQLVRGAMSVLGGNFPLVGGAAADDMDFKKTYQYYNGEVLTNSAVGCVISGAVQFGVGADHGWEPIGEEMTVTKAEGTTLYELDGKPAFSIYEDYFGDRSSDFKKTLSLASVSYPLGMKVVGREECMIRVPLSIQDDGSIVCGAEVMEGSTISLMLGSVDGAIAAAAKTTETLALLTQQISPKLVFLSNCVARKILYGEHITEELKAIKKVAGDASHIVGFYSYGQIAPLDGKVKDVNTCDPGFYEQSISITALGE
jgi:hypothetical protein